MDGIDRRRFLGSTAVSACSLIGTQSRCTSAADVDLSPRLQALDAYIRRAMRAWNVPGLAISVVHRGSVARMKGYGVLALGKARRVSSLSRFPIASCTKSFTAAALASLVDTGSLHWDDPVMRHLPALEIDPRITVRHALCHRSGLPNTNMLWRRGDFSSDEILARLKTVPPIAAPGEKFAYNNIMYLVLGKVVEAISGKRWREFLRSTWLEPLSMNATSVDGSDLRDSSDLAAPHRIVDGQLRPTQRYVANAIAPAGAIHSNVKDLSKWLLFHLEPEVRKQLGILSEQRTRQLHSPPSVPADEAPRSQGVPDEDIDNYGLGWFFRSHQGHQVIEHTGSVNGFISWVTIVPDRRFGLAILANRHNTGLPYGLRSWLLDGCFGKPEFDWSEHVRRDYQNGFERLLREAKDTYLSTRRDRSASRDIEEYTGEYVSDCYGKLRVARDGDRLTLNFGTRFRGKLDPWRRDAFRVYFDDPAHHDWLVTFQVRGPDVLAVEVQEAPWAPDWYDDADHLGEFVKVLP